MKFLALLLLPLPLLADATLGSSASQYERVNSNPVTNRAWRLDVVQVRNGQLDDPTGTLAAKADVEFLSAVESGISLIHQAGTNGFNVAKTNFLQTVSSHPPQNATMIAAVFKPYSTPTPANKNLYGFLASETNGCNWFLSRPFQIKPRLLAQDTYLDDNGNETVKYSEVEWTSYLTDATNSPAPYAEGEWTRIIRSTDPASPVTGAVIVRSHHMNFGNPDTGFNVGSLNIGVRPDPDQATVRYGITGSYTDTVNRIAYKFEKGVFKEVKGY